MSEFIVPFVLGFLGSGHCLGMCGPLVLALSMQEGKPTPMLYGSGFIRPKGVQHHLAFQSGRLLTYGLLGGLAAAMFQVASLAQFFQGLRGGVTLLGGCITIIFGLILLRFLPTPGFLASGRVVPEVIRRKLPLLFGSKGAWPKLLLGMLAGFMPCGLSWGMLVIAAATQEMSSGFFIMTAFGLGTLPALLIVGLFSSSLSMRLRLTGERLAACGVLLMGIFMVLKGSTSLLA